MGEPDRWPVHAVSDVMACPQLTKVQAVPAGTQCRRERAGHHIGRDDVEVLVLHPGGQVQRVKQLSDAGRDSRQPGTGRVLRPRPTQRQQVGRLGHVQPQCPRERLQHLPRRIPVPALLQPQEVVPADAGEQRSTCWMATRAAWARSMRSSSSASLGRYSSSQASAGCDREAPPTRADDPHQRLPNRAASCIVVGSAASLNPLLRLTRYVAWSRRHASRACHARHRRWRRRHARLHVSQLGRCPVTGRPAPVPRAALAGGRDDPHLCHRVRPAVAGLPPGAGRRRAGPSGHGPALVGRQGAGQTARPARTCWSPGRATR